MCHITTFDRECLLKLGQVSTGLEARSTRHGHLVRVWCFTNSTVITGFTGLAPSSAHYWRQGFTCSLKCSNSRRPIRDKTWTIRKRRCSTLRSVSRDQTSLCTKPTISRNLTARLHPLNPEGVVVAEKIVAITRRRRAVPIQIRPAEASQTGRPGEVETMHTLPRMAQQPTALILQYRTPQAVQQITLFQAVQQPTFQAVRRLTHRGSLMTLTDEDLMSKPADMRLGVLVATDFKHHLERMMIEASFSTSTVTTGNRDWRFPNLRRWKPFARRLLASCAFATVHIASRLLLCNRWQSCSIRCKLINTLRNSKELTLPILHCKLRNHGL